MAQSDAEHRLPSTSSRSGASSVDLYGQQIGSRLEDVASFAKSVGGSPTNIAIGAARLGLKARADHRRSATSSSAASSASSSRARACRSKA